MILWNLLKKFYVPILFFILLGMVGGLIKWNAILRENNARQSKNVLNLTQKYTRELSLKDMEYNALHLRAKEELDSVMLANNYKLNQLMSATVSDWTYKDTTIINITESPALPQEDGSYLIPVEYIEKCWNMKGVIQTKDENAQLQITERGASTSVQLLVIRKRFLGFLWFTKKTQFKAFTDCGELDVTKIDFADR